VERLTVIGDGVVRVEVDGRNEIVYVAGPPGNRWAFWNGRAFRWTGIQRDSQAAKESRRRSTSMRVEVTAPMPAKIVAVKVAEGAQVAAGDTLVVLEAMKMELPVAAPSDGRVRAVTCKEGELVQGDAVLVELE
jgi:3-methylcrotonyl-CoA carboxylase alpha subunit